jgi:RimJ/RimL family protein N-acetyltransferase
MARYKSFDTERLHIVPTTIDDAPFILELLNTPKWLAFIGDRNVYSLPAAYDYIQDRILTQYDRLGFGNYTMMLKGNGTKVGACGLYDRTGVEGIDIGFAMLPNFERQGYAFEAASKLIEAAATEFELRSIKAITLAENMDSRKLLEKLGLTYQETIRLPGDDQDVMVYQVNLS